ncbi:hypothetical protein OH687_25695 [Burkholderia anthina]|nr:hypothetical protein OH687_25695 [Burkholderia anthina]
MVGQVAISPYDGYHPHSRHRPLHPMRDLLVARVDFGRRRPSYRWRHPVCRGPIQTGDSS